MGTVGAAAALVPDPTLVSQLLQVQTTAAEAGAAFHRHHQELAPVPMPQQHHQEHHQEHHPEYQQEHHPEHHPEHQQEHHQQQHHEHEPAEAAAASDSHHHAYPHVLLPGGENKWSKNGYGQPCPPPQNNGKFSPAETTAVRRAIEEYCAAKSITAARLCSECDHKAELKGAWMEIARRLPHRTVQSVYRHGLRQLHPFKRGPWGEEEVTLLLDLVHRYGKKWSAIQSKLNRSADSCRDKYREMSSDYIKGRWKEGETEILKRLVREQLRADPNADVVDLARRVEREGFILPWSSISKRMGKRSRLSCFKKWQKLTGTSGEGAEGRGGKKGGGKSGPPKVDASQQQQQQPLTASSVAVAATAAAVAADAPPNLMVLELESELKEGKER